MDALVGELTDANKAALARFKPVLLEFLSGRETLRDDRLRFDAKPSRYPGYTCLYDPVGGEWHHFPTRDCYPTIVELASKNRREEELAPPKSYATAFSVRKTLLLAAAKSSGGLVRGYPPSGRHHVQRVTGSHQDY